MKLKNNRQTLLAEIKKLRRQIKKLEAGAGKKKFSDEQFRLLQLAVHDAEDSVLITDAELEPPGPRIVFVNPGFTRLTGYSGKEVLGQTPRILQGPKTDRKVLDRLKQCLKNGKPFSGETINFRKNGEEYYLEWHISPIRNRRGKITHFVSVQRDVTERILAQEISEKLKQQTARTAAIVVTQEEERRRIAKELHDGLGQMLVAAKFNLEILQERLNEPESVKRLNEVKDVLNNVMNETRRISYNLMPSVLEDFGLGPALNFLCEQVAQTNNIPINFHTHDTLGRLPVSMEIGLYRIAQEALNNIVQHAQARQVNVQVFLKKKRIRMIIEDDGKGFTVKTSPMRMFTQSGNGLFNMRERAESLGGTFFIHSQPGYGTEIVVEAPISNHEKSN